MSNIIAVQDLINSKESRTSNGVTLTGMLFIVSKSSQTEKGLVQLVDVETKQTISCIVNQFIPNYHRSKVSIKEWNYIFDIQSGYRYLEFLVDSIFTDTVNETILFKHLAFQNKYVKSLSNSFYVPRQSLSCKKDQKNSIAGKVYSISALFQQPNTQTYFLLQLERDDCCVTIRFSGDHCERYYRYFVIGVYYCFLKLDIIKEGDNHIFLFHSNSTTCIITETNYNQLVIEPDHSKFPLTISNVEPQIQFTGYITRVIDPLFGIYELENQLILCLFYYMDYAVERPYRVDTKISISDFHTTRIKSGGQTSYLLHLWDIQPNSPVMIACQKSRVEVKSFPNHCIIPYEDMRSIQLKQLVYLDIIKKQVNFLQFIQRLEIYASLNFKFLTMGKDELFKSFQSICKVVFDKVEQCKISLEGYLNHESNCDIVTFKESIVLYSYPSLNIIKTYFENQLLTYNVNLVGDSHAFQENRVSIKYASVENSFYIIGQVKMKDDGRIMIADVSDQIILNTTQHVELDGVYLSKKAQYFSEDLRIENMTYNYISCGGNDLFTLYRPEVSTLQIQQDLKSIDIDYFRCNQLVRKGGMIIHVVNTFPMELVSNKYMEYRAVVKVYSIFGSEGEHISNHTEERRIILVANNQSLKYSRQLQLDAWCFITGIRLDTNNSTYILSEEFNEIHPIINSSQNIKNSIQIKAIGIPCSIQPTKEVYDVSQFVQESLIPDISYTQKNKFFYDKPISIKGLILSKNFSDRFNESCSSDEKSKHLFNSYGIGTGKTKRTLQVDIRDLNGLDTIKLYINSTNQHYPLGLIPGNIVTFNNLIRKHQAKNSHQFHCVTDNISTIEINSYYKETMDTVNLDNIETVNFNQLQQEIIDNEDKENNALKAHCYIRFIISLKFKWVCKGCGITISNNKCYGCKSKEHEFIASAFVQFSDGTGNVNANIDGEELIFKLLNLTPKQSEALKKSILEFGLVNYKGMTKSSEDNAEKQKIGYDFNDICKNAKSQGTICIYAKRQYKTSKNLKETVFLGFMRSWEFEKPVLKIVEIEKMNPVNHAYQLLLKGLNDYMNE